MPASTRPGAFWWQVLPALAITAGLGIAPARTSTCPHTSTVTTVYVANNSSVSVTPVNAATSRAGRAIRVPSNPFAFAATPDGKTVYVATGTAIVPVDTATDTTETPIPGLAVAFVVSPDGATLYALIATDDGDSVVPISTATNRRGRPIPLPVGPAGDYITGMVIAPDGQTAYVADRTAGTVISVDLATGTVGTPIPVGPPGETPQSLAITPDGSTVYAAGTAPGTGIVPISTATDTAGPEINVPGDLFTVSQVSADGSTLWALAANGFLDRIDVATDTALPAIRIRGELLSMTLTPQAVYVGQGLAWGRLLRVNAVTGIRGPDIPGARFITASTLSPDGSTVWAVGRDSRTVLPVSVATGEPGTPVPVGENPAAVIVVHHCR